MDKTLPANYVFLLRCCGERTCPHPLCAAQIDGGDGSINQPSDKGDMFCICRQPEENFMICCDQCGQWFHGDCVGVTEEDGEKMDCYVCQNCKQPAISPENDFVPAWYPGGPSFYFFPYPVIDSTRPWGSECASCGNCCSGHYVTDVDQLLALRGSSRAMRAIPPSIIIEESFKKGSPDVDALAKKCCLTTDEVNMWLQHLQKKKATRQKAVLKAKETRERKKRHQTEIAK